MARTLLEEDSIEIAKPRRLRTIVDSYQYCFASTASDSFVAPWRFRSRATLPVEDAVTIRTANRVQGTLGLSFAIFAAIACSGSPSTTGSNSSAGGDANVGGQPTTGGAPNTGVTSATGGSSANGGAAPTGGAGTAGGSSGTQGCGLTSVPAACSTAGSPCTMDVSGTARTYYVYLPSNYNSSQKYPLVFQFHPMGGTAEQAINMPSIRNSFPAIYVTPQGLTSNGNTGWANSNGQDIAFTKQMVATVEANYCVDTGRIFSTGFSYGGMMSFAVGCEMSNVFRAIAPMSGALYSDFNCKGTGPAIAMWGSHGLSDNVVPIADGRAGRDKILQQNKCGTTTTATTPSPCVSYEGCTSGYPSTWCEFDGSHQIPSFASSAIATFFKQF
jgi:polyhydroxybutyrate depolymerase